MLERDVCSDQAVVVPPVLDQREQLGDLPGVRSGRRPRGIGGHPSRDDDYDHDHHGGYADDYHYYDVYYDHYDVGDVDYDHRTTASASAAAAAAGVAFQYGVAGG
jgi:hypothetical protein